MPFIFQNSSYVLGYGLQDQDFQLMTDFYAQRSIRSLHCSSFEELSDCLRKVRYLVALVVGAEIQDEGWTQLKENLDDLGLDRQVVFGNQVPDSWGLAQLPPAESLPALQSRFQEILDLQVPDRLDELMVASVNALLPSYMPDSGLEFKTFAHMPTPDDFDVMTVCHVAAEPFVGQGLQYANLHLLASHYAPVANKTDTQLRDYVREFLNQFLGLLNRSLLKLDLVTSIGVPEQHDRERVAQVRRTGPYLPMITLADDKGIFQFRLGFVHREGRQKMDLSSLDFQQEDEDIDFF